MGLKGRLCGAGGVSVRSGGRSSVTGGQGRGEQCWIVGGGGRRCGVALVMGAGGCLCRLRRRLWI
jgi:hypothetical protein